MSCQEIKASEGTSAVNGNYWLYSIKPGQVVLVSCDMRTGGELYGGVSVSYIYVFDVINTRISCI